MGDSVTWEIFKKAFVDWFFHWKMREENVVELINLCQGGMSVHEYSFKFTKLSKYAPSLVSNPRDETSHFLIGVSDDFQEECH